MTVVVVLISRLKSGECGSMCPLKCEQARREMQQWVMRRLPTADCIVEIRRKSRSWIKVLSHRMCYVAGDRRTVPRHAADVGTGLEDTGQRIARRTGAHPVWMDLETRRQPAVEVLVSSGNCRPRLSGRDSWIVDAVVNTSVCSPKTRRTAAQVWRQVYVGWGGDSIVVSSRKISKCTHCYCDNSRASLNTNGQLRRQYRLSLIIIRLFTTQVDIT